AARLQRLRAVVRLRGRRPARADPRRRAGRAPGDPDVRAATLRLRAGHPRRLAAAPARPGPPTVQGPFRPMGSMVSVPYVLWVVYHLVALPMAVWTAVGATFRGTGKGARHRLATAATAAVLPFVAAGTIAAAFHDVAPLRFGLLPFALLGLAASWANVVALHDRRWIAKLVHLP